MHLVTVVGSLSKELSLNEPVVLSPPCISDTWGLVKNKDMPSPTLRIRGWGTKPELRITEKKLFMDLAEEQSLSVNFNLKLTFQAV